jgi:hypothetical protein
MSAMTNHGHGHRGTEIGITLGGVQVRNVAQPVVKRAYKLFCFEEDDPACHRRGGAQRLGGLANRSNAPG